MAFLLGEENLLLSEITRFLYPRLEVERTRLSTNFFIEKADQLVIRTSLCLFVIFFIYVNRYKKLLPEVSTSKRNITVLRVLFYLGLMWAGREIFVDLISLQKLDDFYKPVLILKLLHVDLPGKAAVVFITTGFFVFCLLALLDIKPVISSVIAILLFILYQAFLYSFEKVEHAYATINYVGFLMPFLLLEARINRTETYPSFFLSLIILIVAGCYFLSGIEKLFTAGFHWLHPSNFQAYLLMHGTKAGIWLSSNNFLLILLPLASLLFQLSFLFVVWFPGMRYILIPAGIVFHWGTVILFGISSFINPWIIPYIFFIRWDKIKPLSFLKSISAKKPAEGRISVGN